MHTPPAGNGAAWSGPQSPWAAVRQPLGFVAERATVGPVDGTTGAGAGTATGAGAWPKGAISGTGTTGAGACTGTGGAFGSSAPTEFGSAAFAAATAAFAWMFWVILRF